MRKKKLKDLQHVELLQLPTGQIKVQLARYVKAKGDIPLQLPTGQIKVQLTPEHYKRKLIGGELQLPTGQIKVQPIKNL